MAEKSELTPRRKKAIVSLLSCKNVPAAAIAAKIGERTLYRWMAEPEFKAALMSAEGDAIDQAARRLIIGQDQALDTLEDLMENANSERVRREAANDWLTHLLKIRELRNVEQRLAELEAAVYDNKR